MNVTLNRHRAITGVFAGELVAAHDAACAYARKSAMRAVAEPFDVVLTTNSGYPLDMNLYQAVKGMSAAAQIVKPGGAIVIAAECREGVGHGHFAHLLTSRETPRALLELIYQPDFCMVDQWQVQLLAEILTRCSTSTPTNSTRARFAGRTCRRSPTSPRRSPTCGPPPDPGARVGVLPEGPLTIPYLG